MRGGWSSWVNPGSSDPPPDAEFFTPQLLTIILCSLFTPLTIANAVFAPPIVHFTRQCPILPSHLFRFAPKSAFIASSQTNQSSSHSLGQKCQHRKQFHVVVALPSLIAPGKVNSVRLLPPKLSYFNLWHFWWVAEASRGSMCPQIPHASSSYSSPSVLIS